VSLRFSAILTSKGIVLLWAQLGAAPFFCHPLPATWSITGHTRTSMPAAGALTKLISPRRCHTCLLCASALNTTFRFCCEVPGYALHSGRYQILVLVAYARGVPPLVSIPTTQWRALGIIPALDRVRCVRTVTDIGLCKEPSIMLIMPSLTLTACQLRPNWFRSIYSSL
jgi:hypothetical protein